MLTWVKDNDRFETRQFSLIDVKSLYLETQLRHDSIEYLHNASLNCHVTAECVAGSEAHLLWLDRSSFKTAISVPSVIFDVL